jgi:hypothetical protein
MVASRLGHARVQHHCGRKLARRHSQAPFRHGSPARRTRIDLPVTMSTR